MTNRYFQADPSFLKPILQRLNDIILLIQSFPFFLQRDVGFSKFRLKFRVLILYDADRRGLIFDKP
jgi:hypothetical protein